MDDAKMAKSAGNIIRVAELPDLGHEPLTFRYLALTAPYRSKPSSSEMMPALCRWCHRR